MKRVSQFIPVGTAGSTIIEVLICSCFCQTGFLKDQKKKKEIERTIGRVEGIKETEERISQQLADWEWRREEALANNQNFTEPLPNILQQSDESEQSSTE